jgi:D-sedoheptulose 7-phosphate isomerase
MEKATVTANDLNSDERIAFSTRYLNEVLPVFQEYKTAKFSQALQAMEKAYQNDNQIFICGNGGSAGTSNHMVNDLSKGSGIEGKRRLRVIGLADNMSLFSAYANDCGYETVFVEQLKDLWNPGDVLIAISASGNSPNVVKAAEFARKNNGYVIGLVGFSGGKLLELSHTPIHFKSHNYGVVEDAQLMFSHLSSQYMCQFIKDKGMPQQFA